MSLHLSPKPCMAFKKLMCALFLLRQETHLLPVESDLNVSKLDFADELANKVGDKGYEALPSFSRLLEIARTPPLFSFWIRQLSFAVLSGTACLLFFNGSLLDGLVATFLGLGVGLLTDLASSNMVVGQVAEFLASIVVAFVARAIATSFRSFCYYPITLGALVWLLPGQRHISIQLPYFPFPFSFFLGFCSLLLHFFTVFIVIVCWTSPYAFCPLFPLNFP